METWNITKILPFLNEFIVPGDIPSQAKHTNEFLTQLILSLIIGISSFLIFCVLRRKVPSIYAPRTRLLK